MAKKVTLFIDDTEIRLLVTRKERVDVWANIPLEPGIVSSGVVLDEDKVAGLLKEQLKLLKIKSKRVIIGLSGMNTLYRIFSMPELPDSMLPEAVKHEAERAMPISLDDVYISYQRIPSAAGEIKVFVATFPKKAADSMVKTLHKAGLEPYLMDLAPLAFSRVVGVPRAVLANFQTNHLDIVILIDRVPQVIRSLSMAEVESTQEKLSTIAEELERTIAFYNSTEKEKPIDNTVPILFCGELDQQQESLQLISTRLGFNITVMMPPVEAPEFFDACRFMVNIGLIFKEREKGAAEFSIVNFNALPEFYIPRHIALPNVLAPVGIVATAGMVIIMVIISTSSGGHTQALRLELSTIQSYLSQQQKDVTANRARLTQLQDQLKPQETEFGALKSRLDQLKASHVQIDRDLSALTGNAPETVKLLSASRTTNTITVSGISSDRYSIYDYARGLTDSKRFASVSIDSIELVKTEPAAPTTLEGSATPPETAPPAPAPTTGAALKVFLTWTDNSLNESGFHIQRALDPGFTVSLNTFQVGPDVTSYTDTGLAPATTYYYRILAFNDAGDSDSSNIISVVTLSVELPPAPGNLSATTESATTEPGQTPTPGAQPSVNSYVFTLTIQLIQAPKPKPTPTPTPSAAPRQTAPPIPFTTPTPIPKTTAPAK